MKTLKYPATLSYLLNNLNETNQTALIFDAFSNQNNFDFLTYEQLKNSIKKIGNFLNEKLLTENQTNLFAVFTKTWEKNFFQLLLSILISNNAYIIIDTKWPDDYINAVIDATKPNFILFDYDVNEKSLPKIVENLINEQKFSVTDESFLYEFNYKIISNNLQPKQFNDLAYVISTSGTTGMPKIIHVCNSSIMPNIIQLSELFQIENGDVIYQASALTFDPSLIEIFCSLYTNSTLLVLPQNIKLIPEKLCSYLKKHRVNILQLTPSLFKNISGFIQNLSLKILVLGGEKFPSKRDVVKELIRKGVLVYNIYGITELSCWSSCHLVNENDLDNEDGVSIGELLNETDFFLKTSNNESLVDLKTITDSNTEFSGVLLHSSKTRVCYVNSVRSTYLDSGDFVKIKNKKIFIQQRKNEKSIKINGKLVDLTCLEKIFKGLNCIENVYPVISDESLFLIAITNENLSSSYDKETLEDLIRRTITQTLPDHYQPRKIVFIKHSEKLPLTNHGKFDINKLIKNSQDKEEFDAKNSRDLVKSIWTRVLNVEPNDEDNFILSGGSSLNAVVFIDHLQNEIETNKLNRQFNPNLLLDVLLNKNFRVFTRTLETLLQNKNVNQEKNIPEAKKIKLDQQEINPVFTNLKITGWISKLDKHFLNKDDQKVDLNNTQNVNFNWKFNTFKCVDATPLLICALDKNLLLAGSHSTRFVCLNAADGELEWEFKCSDRIESSACISACRNFAIFGSYDRNLYVLRLKDGFMAWKFETGDVVKSTPVVNMLNGHVYFGSHDKHLYSLDIYSKSLVWKVNLDDSSIFAGVACGNNTDLYSTTLAGNLFCLDWSNGVIKWRLELDRPIFTTPVLNKEKDAVYMGTCGGSFYSISTDKKILWRFKVEQAIFSTACLFDEYVLFGAHDNYLYCLNRLNGCLIWRFNCESPIYSSPATIFNRTKIVTISSDGVLFLLNSNNGELKLTRNLFHMKNSCFSSPIIHKNRIYVGARDNFIYSISID